MLWKSMFTEGNDFPVVINYRIFLIVISRLFRVVIILLTDKHHKYSVIFLSQVLAVLEEEEDINEVQLKRKILIILFKKLYKLLVNLPYFVKSFLLKSTNPASFSTSNTLTTHGIYYVEEKTIKNIRKDATILTI